MSQGVAGKLGDLPRHLNPGGPAADDHERQLRLTPLRVRLQFGRLERGQDVAPHPEGALQRLDLGRVLPPLVVPEVRVRRAAGDDQRVVWDRGRGRHSIDRAKMHLTPI